MKFAGVHTSGKSKGEVIELSPMEKVPLAVKMAAADYDPDFSISVTDIKLGATRHTPKGDPLKRKFQNNNYVSEGDGLFYFRRRVGDVLLEPKRKKFKIEFCDCLDSYGMPELKVAKFTLA
jgi:hypothetical protein